MSDTENTGDGIENTEIGTEIEVLEDVVDTASETDSGEDSLADEVVGKAIGDVREIPMAETMSESYLNYALSVIMSRALPDVRDGLKPVHRRVVYGASAHSKGMVKSARIVGDVMGKYHPHGDVSIYESLVRMARSWTMRFPLILGQGNFGSRDGDSPAAMRYTEAQLRKQASLALMKDVELDTVDFNPNYDGSEIEPSVLPARIPLLLINGVEGIAVGFASSIPPHNPEEVVKATIEVIRNPDVTGSELRQIMPGPDFPTGAISVDNGGYAKAFDTGKGSVHMVGTYEIKSFESGKKAGRQQVIITSLPYEVNKAKLVAHINELKNAKGDLSYGFNDIAEVRDESAKEDIRIVLDLKKGANTDLIIKNLSSRTAFATSFNYNMVVRTPSGKPQLLGVRQIIDAFIDFRREVLWRRTNCLLEKERKRLRTLTGLFAARTQIRDVVKIIQDSEDSPSAKLALQEMNFPVESELAKYLKEVEPDDELPEVFHLTAEQAQSILDMRLSNLTKLQLNEISEEAIKLREAMQSNLHLLADKSAMDELMIAEMEEFMVGYGPCPRLTTIERGVDEVEDYQLLPNIPVVLSVTQRAYVKITEVNEFQEQARGGTGRKAGPVPRDEDYVAHAMPCMTHDMITFFTSLGMAYAVRAEKFPMDGNKSPGRPIINYGVELKEGEKITAVIKMPATAEEAEQKFLMFVTEDGNVRRNRMSDFMNINRGGKIAMKPLEEGGEVKILAVLTCEADKEDLILASSSGRAARLQINDKNVRIFASRNSVGSRGIKLGPNERCVSACIVPHYDAESMECKAYLAGGEKHFPGRDGEPDVTIKLTAEQMQQMAAAEKTLITVSEKGIGKRFSSYEVRTVARGGKGVNIGTFTLATGGLAGLLSVDDGDGLLLVTNKGMAVRTGCGGIGKAKTSRTSKGVKLLKIKPGDSVASVCVLKPTTEDEFVDNDLEEQDEDDIDSDVADESSLEHGNEDDESQEDVNHQTEED
ncbi:DNA gyrase subunit A [Acetobacter pomorum]|uniref:DNA topoisomerase (ATP-hydrolyzing) n=1 Tax=Acetobacter pomorum TaxID=65959 RepID=A0A2G4RED4_9PROT|nr:DNA gyrase subunit A [Acetobacter pomorum]PHY94951.1 DNA gyrase subunit A [Acetobacter pomorum]GBR51556.1 DNA gyrase subunit A [Acetobacter pomorum DSM 11825]